MLKLLALCLACDRAVAEAERLGWPATHHGVLRARAEAYAQLHAAVVETERARERYLDSFS